MISFINECNFYSRLKHKNLYFHECVRPFYRISYVFVSIILNNDTDNIKKVFRYFIFPLANFRFDVIVILLFTGREKNVITTTSYRKIGLKAHVLAVTITPRGIVRVSK